MGEIDNTDLENELEKSIEKLVDEETSVAKAFVDRNSDATANNEATISQQDDMLGRTQVIPNLGNRVISVDDIEKTKPRLDLGEIPERRVVEARQSVKNDGEPEENRPVRVSKGSSDKSINKRNKYTILAIVAGVVLVVFVIVMIAIGINAKGEKGFSYNYSKGTELFDQKNYKEALKYFENASMTDEGRKNIEMKLKMAQCYIDTGDGAKGVETLNDILAIDKYNEKAIATLVKYYSDNKDGASLTKLVNSYMGTNGEKFVAAYAVKQPVASVASGSYTDSFELELKSSDGNAIYYTINGDDPTTKNAKYTSPIKVEKGETTIKAIAVDGNQVASKVLELKYVVNYQVPSAPQVSPVSGSYESGTQITINGLKDGDTAYYTLDGSQPTTSSAKYTGPIDMPSGNTILSVVVVNKYNLESSVTKMNYIVTKTSTFSFDEAKDLLIGRMKSKGEIKADGSYIDGSAISFVYYTKTTIDKEEMFLIYCDIKKDGKTTRQDYYYGVGVKSGLCYKVYEKNGAYTANDY